MEISVKNKTALPLSLPLGFVTFVKPGYTVFRTDTLAAAKQAALAAGERFTPTPPPYVAPSTTTTVNATGTTYGNQTQLNGTATTTTDNSGQAGANFGNALGNAISASRFQKMQREEAVFSAYLAAHNQTELDSTISPGQMRTVVATFQQAKAKKAPFEIQLQVGESNFVFGFKE